MVRPSSRRRIDKKSIYIFFWPKICKTIFEIFGLEKENILKIYQRTLISYLKELKFLKGEIEPVFPRTYYFFSHGVLQAKVMLAKANGTC